MQSWLGKNFGNNSNSRVRTERFYYGWVVVLALVIIGVISQGIRFSFGVFFESLESDFGLTRALTSEIFSVYMVFGSVFGIVGGWALDRYGPKVVVAVMGFFIGLSLLLTSQAGASWHLFITYSLLLAIGTGATYPLVMSTASRWFVKRRGLALGIASSGLSLGMMVMPPIAAWLIAHYGWQASYFIMALMAVFIIIPCTLLIRKAPSELIDLPPDERLAAKNAGSSKGQSHSEPRELSLLQLAKTRNFWLILLMSFLWASSAFIVLTHIVRHAIDLGITSMQAATILSLIGGMAVLGRLVVGRLSDSIGRKQGLVISTLVAAGAMLWLTQASNLWMLYLFAVLFGFAFGGGGPVTAALITEVFGLRRLGVLMGINSASWGIGAALGPAVAGYIFDISGSYLFAFLAGMVALLIVLPLIVLLRTPTTKTRDEAIW